MTRERLMDALKSATDSELAMVWNEYCYEMKYDDNVLYSMDELDEMLCDCKPSEVARMVSDGFDYRDNYFRFNVYGTLDSYEWASDVVDLEEIIDGDLKYQAYMPTLYRLLKEQEVA